MASGKGSGGKMVVWGILGLLIISLGGFGATNFGGSVSSVASVGDEEVDVNTYARALQNEIAAFEAQTGVQVTIQEAEAFGFTNTVLDGLLTRAALDGEAGRIGISIGDDAVRREILATPAFQGIDGSFDPELYDLALERTGMSRTEFEAGVRIDAARALLQGALATGVTMPETYSKVITEWLGERRSIETATLTAANLETPVGTPDEEQINAYYEANAAAYTAPEARDITYAWLSPAMLSDSVEVDETLLRELYDENIAQFKRPERRLVERLVFDTEENAQAAADRITAGESDFAAEVEARGLELIDTDLGDVTATDLGAAAEVVFEIDDIGVVGPAMTDLGPAIFRINGILEASETPFEEARDDLAVELATDAARRDIAARLEEFDNMLAEGYTLEDLAKETEMVLDQINWTNASEDDIAAYEAFAEAARSVTEDDYPEIIELSDGGVFALRLNGIVPATLRPLDEVRDQVIADWIASETMTRLRARAEELETEVASGTALSTLGLPLETFEEITRRDFVATMPEGFIDAVFSPGVAEGATTVIEGEDRVVVALITRVAAPEKNEEIEAISATYAEQAGQGAAQDVISAFAARLRESEGVSVNQTAVSAVHAQMP
ncbi:peptidyl-prolyl cis-trans isomerase [Celeribacter sp.]|uniref:peptidylprolyl isomerase n=1 Tax=Celeribacter sp. TaxID=1890673 RepID=UPI003A954B2D